MDFIICDHCIAKCFLAAAFPDTPEAPVLTKLELPNHSVLCHCCGGTMRKPAKWLMQLPSGHHICNDCLTICVDVLLEILAVQGEYWGLESLTLRDM